MYPILLIAIGIAVLLLGKRLAVLGAAVGALLGAVLLGLVGASSSFFIHLLFVGGFALAGFFIAGIAKAFVDIILLVIGALAGAAIALAVFGPSGIFIVESRLLVWLFALVGGVVGLMMVRRYKDWAMIVLAGLIGGLLVTRGLSTWLPAMQGALGSLTTIVLAGGSIAYEGGFLTKGVQPAPPAK